MTYFIAPNARASDSNNNPMSGAGWHFFETGTTTPVETYTTVERTVAHAHPVVADAGGKFPSIYLDPAITYRAQLKTAAGSILLDVDPYDVSSGDSTILDIAPFTQVSTLEIPEEVQQVRTYAFDVPTAPLAGTGSANFIADPEVDEAYVAAAPYGSAFIDANGRGFRMNELFPNAFQFGATDAVGTIKLEETAVDCSDALDALCAWWISQKGKVIMDFSGVTGLGITRTWVWDTGLGTAAWWNSPIYRFIPGRLIAMESLIDTSVDPDVDPSMGYMVHTKGREYHNVGGAFELWAGTDTIINAGHMNANARGGLYIEGAGGSSFGKVTGQGFPRYLVQTAKINTSLNNNIPLNFEEIRAVQCGSISDKLFTAVPTEGFGIFGDYTEGQWLGDNGSHNQTHRMKIAVPDNYAWHLEIGDAGRFNETKFGIGIIQEVFERTSTYIDCAISYWQKEGRVTGSVVFMQGGACSAWGDKLGASNFGRVFSYNCGTGFQVQTLFSPIAQVCSEICQIGIQFGGIVQSAIHGLGISQRHLENNLITVLDCDTSGSDCDIGLDSTTLPDDEGLFGKVFRLQAGYKSGDTFTGYNTKGMQGIRVSHSGGILDAGAGGVISLSGDTEPFLSNAPPRQFHGPKNMSEIGDSAGEQEFTITLNYDRSIGRLFNHARTCWIGPIFSNEGTNGAPLGTITIQPDPAQSDITVSGTATLTIPPQTAGAIWLYFVAEPDDFGDEESTVDWKVFMETRPIK